MRKGLSWKEMQGLITWLLSFRKRKRLGTVLFCFKFETKQDRPQTFQSEKIKLFLKNMLLNFNKNVIN